MLGGLCERGSVFPDLFIDGGGLAVVGGHDALVDAGVEAREAVFGVLHEGHELLAFTGVAFPGEVDVLGDRVQAGGGCGVVVGDCCGCVEYDLACRVGNLDGDVSTHVNLQGTALLLIQ